MDESTPTAARVTGLSVRRNKTNPPEERPSITVDPTEGVHDDHGRGMKRQVTIIARESWRDAEGVIGHEIPWITRRANVLVEGLDLSTLLDGGVLRLGACTIEILGETFPCDLMDRLEPGLKAALLPETRGGVYGRVVDAGTISVGDVASIERPGVRRALP